MRRAAWSLLSALLAGAGCAHGAPAPGAAFATGEVRIVSAADTAVLRVEIAENERQHRLGLSRRPELPEGRGMIFLFPGEQPRGTTFWMYRTTVPLSLALLDADGVIREIRDLAPCRSPVSLLCRRYATGVPFHAALEVGRGYFERRGIAVGDRVRLRRDRGPGSPGPPAGSQKVGDLTPDGLVLEEHHRARRQGGRVFTQRLPFSLSLRVLAGEDEAGPLSAVAESMQPSA